MERDILLGLRYIDDEHVAHRKFRFTRASANALASRYYLYKSHNHVNRVDEPVIDADEVLSASEDGPIFLPEARGSIRLGWPCAEF